MNDDRLFRQILTALIAILIVFPLTVIILWQVRTILYPVVTALVAAYLLYPTVNLASRFGIPKGLVIVTIIFLLLGSIIGIAVSLIPVVRAELNAIAAAEQSSQLAATTSADATTAHSESVGTSGTVAPASTDPAGEGTFDLFDESEITMPDVLRLNSRGSTPRTVPTSISLTDLAPPTLSLPMLPLTTDPLDANNLAAKAEEQKAKDAARSRLVGIVQDLHGQLFMYGIVNRKHLENDEIIRVVSGWISDWYIPLLRSIGLKVMVFSQFLMIFFFVMTFALLDGNKFYKVLVGLIPNSHFETGLFILNKSELIMGFYLRGVAVETVVLGLLSLFLLTILCLFTSLTFGTATVIALIIALTNPVRIVGPIFGGFVGAFIVLITTPTLPALIGVVVIAFLTQLADNTLVLPLVMREQVDVHPVLILLGVISGGMLAGILGMILAIPMIAGFKVVYRVITVEIKRYEADSPGSFSLEPDASWE